ncbi:cu(2+) suppressing and bleomycin sensitive protein 1 [Monosporozyma servazzii]
MSVSMTVPKEEETILNYLLGVRASLAKLKQNRAQFLNSKEVQNTYQDVLTKVRELDEIRKSNTSFDEATLIHNTDLHNRVDSVLDDVFQLLSLSFLTVGLKNSAPATYASLSTVQNLLEHLEESKIYTHHDLKPIKDRLDEISQIVEKSCSQPLADVSNEEAELTAINTERNKNKLEQDLLLRIKLQHCIDQYTKIESNLEDIDPELNEFMEKLYQIRRGLLSLIQSLKDTGDSSTSDNQIQDVNNNKIDDVTQKYTVLKAQLEAIETEVRNFNEDMMPGQTRKGESVLNGLLDDCNDLVNDLSYQSEDGQSLKISLDPYLQEIYDKLIVIKTSLANLMITRRWTLRETDLFSYQKQLSEIDSKRVHGKFPTKSGNSKGQSILLYLLRRCYAIIYKLLESSEPVSESLQPIHNQLSTVRRCLLELKRMGGVENDRELYPYQMKLASLDNMRSDGKFYDSDGNIPEGQGILNALLAGCFDIIHELEVEAEERENSESANDEDEDD